MLRVAETLNHGMGVFATQSTPVGTLLWREKPLVKLDMEEVARETERMMAARNKGEDGMATATRVMYIPVNCPTLCCCSLGLCIDCLDFHNQITRKSSTAMCYAYPILTQSHISLR